eukprot:7074950-Prymnesium_polylepis.1
MTLKHFASVRYTCHIMPPLKNSANTINRKAHQMSSAAACPTAAPLGTRVGRVCAQDGQVQQICSADLAPRPFVGAVYRAVVDASRNSRPCPAPSCGQCQCARCGDALRSERVAPPEGPRARAPIRACGTLIPLAHQPAVLVAQALVLLAVCLDLLGVLRQLPGLGNLRRPLGLDLFERLLLHLLGLGRGHPIGLRHVRLVLGLDLRALLREVGRELPR